MKVFFTYTYLPLHAPQKSESLYFLCIYVIQKKQLFLFKIKRAFLGTWKSTVKT